MPDCTLQRMVSTKLKNNLQSFNAPFIKIPHLVDPFVVTNENGHIVDTFHFWGTLTDLEPKENKS